MPFAGCAQSETVMPAVLPSGSVTLRQTVLVESSGNVKVVGVAIFGGSFTGVIVTVDVPFEPALALAAVAPSRNDGVAGWPIPVKLRTVGPETLKESTIG